MKIESELEKLREFRAYIQHRIDILEEAVKAQKEKAERRTTKVSDTGGYVRTAQIAPYLRSWIDQGNTLVQLAEHSGVDEKTLRNVLREKNKHMWESTADRVMTAMGLPYSDITSPSLDAHNWEE